jgi:polyhydroxyalkanoate synthesis repressor PhaR
LLHCSINQTVRNLRIYVKMFLPYCAEQHASQTMKTSAILVKKYGNRRLYDTAGSRYVNLDDLAAMIRAGKDVHVIDAKTGRDLTRVTLTQIITEDAKGKPTGLPLELLRQLIVASDEVRQEFLMWYLKSAFDTYEKLQSAVQSRLSEVQSAILSPVDMMKRFLSAASSSPQRADEEPEVQALRRRVAELEARLAQPMHGKRRAPKKR